jgi:hypothetical protein
MRPRSNFERRKVSRIPTPNGLWVSWKSGDTDHTSRVEDFSTSGVFISSEETLPVGKRVKLLFSLPEGQIHVEAIVRNSIKGRGMGMEFVSMGGKEFDIILKAMKRLLPKHEKSR